VEVMVILLIDPETPFAEVPPILDVEFKPVEKEKPKTSEDDVFDW
jgi:hypothetical protein